MTAPKDPSGKAVAEILAGRHDGRLVDLAEAIAQRIRSSSVRVCWRLRLDDDVWDEDTVTGGEIATVERMLSKRDQQFSYTQLDPKTLMGHRTALVVAHLHKVGGLQIDEAITRAEALTLAQHRDLLELYEVVDAPKDQETSPAM